MSWHRILFFILCSIKILIGIAMFCVYVAEKPLQFRLDLFSVNYIINPLLTKINRIKLDGLNLSRLWLSIDQICAVRDSTFFFTLHDILARSKCQLNGLYSGLGVLLDSTSGDWLYRLVAHAQSAHRSRRRSALVSQISVVNLTATPDKFYGYQHSPRNSVAFDRNAFKIRAVSDVLSLYD